MTGPEPDPHEVRAPGRPLVPVLRMEEGPPDATAVAAWHLALSNLVGVDVPHDLLGLWLFPRRGGVLLLAPRELEGDRVAVAAPAPFLHQHELLALENRARQAGYQSAIAVPIRGAQRDMGVALFAALGAGAFGIEQALRLHGVVRGLLPSFEALADAPPFAASVAGDEEAPDDGASLLSAVARAGASARDGTEFLRLLSGALLSVLPHERIEIAVQGSRPGVWGLLSAPPAGHRWGESFEAVSAAVSALIARADEDGLVEVPDLRAGSLAWPAYLASRSAHRVRSVIGVELKASAGHPAWLFVGGAGVHGFRPADRETLVLAAPVVAVRVLAFRQGLAAEVGQAQLQSLQASQPRASRLVALLAGTQHWGETSRQFARETCEALGYDTLRFVLRLGEDRVVTMRPGTLHPLADLPWEALALSPLAGVVRGSVPFLVSGERGQDLAVPLRIAGRPVGALELLGGLPGSTGHPVTAAQYFADVIAPHLELLRRSALPAPGRGEERSAPSTAVSSWRPAGPE